MSSLERFQNVVLGGGEAGKYIAWELARCGQRVAVVEKGLIGGSCPNIACLPSKNVVHSAKIASFAKRAHEFGLEGSPLATSMKGVLHRKQKMVDDLIELHLERFNASGAELMMGTARFIGERTVDVSLNDGGS